LLGGIGGVTAEHQDRKERTSGGEQAKPGHDFEPIGPGHVQVEEDEVRLPTLEQPFDLGRGLGRHHVGLPRTLEHAHEEPYVRRFVVGHEDLGLQVRGTEGVSHEQLEGNTAIATLTRVPSE
jgi:hypothetical protein